MIQQQAPSNIKALTILHFSLLVGQLVFAAIAYYLHYSGVFTGIDLGDNLTIVLVIIAVNAVVLTVLAFTMYKKKLDGIRNANAPTGDKLIAYRAASLIRWAMLEAPVLLAIIAFLITGNINLLLVAGVILILFITTRPTAAKAAAELQLSESDLSA